MKTFLKIKWETILTLMLLVATICGWLFYTNFPHDTRVLAMACITTLMLLMFLVCYQTIKNVRHEILKYWK